MRAKAKDGKLYAEVTLRDVVEKCDVSDLPFLSEVKRLYDENAKLRELVSDYEALTATLCNERECDGCPFDDHEQIVCEHMRLQTCLSELGVGVAE